MACGKLGATLRWSAFMSSVPARNKERRQINVSTPKDRRGKGTERRKCPECQGALKESHKTVAGGTVTTLSCSQCDWSQSSRQTDAGILMAKMTWSLPLEKKPSGLQVPFPAELAEALRIKAGDELVLSPLTLPVGSLPMRWALTLRRKLPKKP
jgi:hypothetical protein